VIVLAGGQAGAAPAKFSRASSTAVLPAAALTLASIGSDGAAAQGQNGQAAIAEQGRYVAFSSSATLKVSAAAPGTAEPCNIKLSSCSNVYVRDQIGHTTTLLGKDAMAPTISATGRLVSYENDELNGGNTIFAANRQATGTGAFDGPGNIVVRPVTGTANDLPYERIPSCPQQFGNPVAMRTTPCGPKLSADGTTLVYPAQRSPISPDLTATTFEGDLGAVQPPGNELDLGTFPSESNTTVVTYTVTGSEPITFDNTPTVSPLNGAFTVSPVKGEPQCIGTISPDDFCEVQVSVNPNVVCIPGILFTGALQTNAAVPAGQSSLALTVVGGGGCIQAISAQRIGRPSHTSTAARSSAVTQQANCPAAPSGLALTAPPGKSTDNNGQALIDLSTREIGAPFVTWVLVGGPDLAQGTVQFQPQPQVQSQPCAIQLVDPATLHLANPFPASANPPPPCTPNETLGGSGNPTECLAYLLIDPSEVTTDVAEIGDGTDSGLVADYVSVTGVSSVVIARRDLSGDGNFAASPSTVVSVDSKGNQIPGATQPSVSATGRYVAFAAPVPAGQTGMQVGGSTEVWRHDTDANGNATFKPGPTVLVSCLPKKPGTCAQAANADSPSLSGDGTRVAFATMPAVSLEAGTPPAQPGPTPSIAIQARVTQAPSVSPTSPSPCACTSAHNPLRAPSVTAVSPDQVDARNIAAGTTVIVSASAAGSGGNGISYAPALSQDGSTVAFVSAAENLTSVTVPARATNLYVRTLAFGPGPSTDLASSSGASLPSGDDIALPAIDAHGRIIAFQTSVQLLPAAPAKFHSVYTFERFPHLVFAPNPVNFGTLSAGSAAKTLTVTVTDSGPGPATVTGIATTAPFGTTDSTCIGAVLYASTSCRFLERLAPQLAGHDQGTATIATTDDGEPTMTSSVPVTVIVLKPQLSLTPDVDFAGQVTLVRGTGFQAGEAVTLSWSQGLGTVTVTVTASVTSSVGGFSTPMVIFPDDIYGPRTLLAKSSTGQLLATAPFLAQVPPVEPPFTAATTP
jgi:hypothetical protein